VILLFSFGVVLLGVPGARLTLRAPPGYVAAAR